MLGCMEDFKNIIYGLHLMGDDDNIRYVGQTRQGITKRFNEHVRLSSIMDPRLANYPVYRWIRKYGRVNISYTILDEFDSPEELNDAEERWIADLETSVEHGGLNVLLGGGSSARPGMMTQEVRAKISAGNMGTKTGTKNASSKLIESQVVDIKSRLFAGEAQASIHRDYSFVSKPLISAIAKDKVWHSVQWPIGPVRSPGRSKWQSETRSGAHNGNNKLSEPDVHDIRRAGCVRGEAAKDIATRYPVTVYAVEKILKNASWKSLAWEVGVQPIPVTGKLN